MEYIETLKPGNAYFKFNVLFYINPKQEKDIFPGYFYNYESIVIWKHDNRKYMYSTELVRHMPFPDFNGIAFIGRTDKTKLIICNPDSTEKFIISPPDFVHVDEYERREFYAHFFKNPIIFESFDDYFEYNNKKYLTVKISKYENEYHDLGISQLRYLDVETGEFLPFTKTIFITTTDFESGNPHIASRNEKIDL
ncbi:hypothetical protein [Chryseobacterium sp.]|uniref:hypothetical protein n=1 Tax=Chryseobacterium sp. TaxID=1871047 RepID=UPI00261A7EB7|nr:hypothetical protein [Chryseobacterium sp.]